MPRILLDMPSKAELDHSRAAIRTLADTMQAVVLGYPEDDPDEWSGLTVDGVLDVGGERWAVEHVRATWEPSTTPAVTDAIDRLLPRLDQIAERHQRGIHVGVYPARGKARAAQYDEVVARAERAAATGHDVFDDDGFTVQISDQPAGAHLSVMLASNLFIGRQIAAGLVPALERKLDRQLAHAKSAGYKVAVIVDQTEPAGIPQSAIPYGLPMTVAQVVAPVLERAPAIVDQLWVRDRAGRFLRILPSP
jgi:hypothetical protein